MEKKNQQSLIVSAPRRMREINVEQQLLIAERDDLQETEEAYKRRVEKLEREAVDMLNNYDTLYNENKILRSKLDVTVTNASGVESYNNVFKERQHLKESNRAFKRRIQQLEDEVENAIKANKDLENENKRLQQESGLEKEYATKAKDLEIRELQTSHGTLDDKVKMLLRDQQQMEYRIGKMDIERTEIEKKYDRLAIENNELKIRCEILEKDRVTLKDTITELEKNIIDPEQKAKDEQMFLNLQNQLISLQVNIKDANVEIQDLKEENRILNKLKSDRENMVDRAISVMSNREEELEKEKLREMERNEMNKDIDDQKQRCGLLLKENDKLKGGIRRLEAELDKIMLERKADSSQILQKEKAISEMREAINFGQGLNDDYDKIHKKYVDSMEQKQVLENKLLEDKRLAKEQIQKMTETAQENERQRMDDQRTGDRFEKNLRNLQSENDTMDKIIEGQSLELKNMKSQIEQLRSLLDDNTSKYENSKEGEKNAYSELRDTKIELTIATKELEELKNQHKGKVNTLSAELKAAKEERLGESEHMKKESEGLKEEVKRLKNFEYKIAIMDGEIKKLLNRLRMADRFRKTLQPRPSIVNKDEVGEVKRKLEEVEKDNMKLIQDKRTWEVTKEKNGEFQHYNARLMEENKRLRRDLESSSYKIDNMETKIKNTHPKTNDVNPYPEQQMAVFIDKTQMNKDDRNAKRNSTLVTRSQLLMERPADRDRDRPFNVQVNNSKASKGDMIPTLSRRSKSTGLAANKVSESSTVMSLSNEMKGGRGYGELHRQRKSPTKNTLPLL